LERQRSTDERYKLIVEQTNTLVFEWWSTSRYISPELMQRFAGTYDERDILRIWQEDQVIHPDDIPLFEAFLLDCQAWKHTEMTVRFRKRDNAFIWCKVVLSCLFDDAGRPYRSIGTLNDVDNATCSAIALQYRAEYDTLTGVYNMQTFHARATQLLHQNPERHYSIIRMDIDRFKVINDLYGMEEGDQLLKTIARLIGERMSPHSVCGHFSGDIFCACVDFSHEQILHFVNDLTIYLANYPLTSRIVPSFGICKVDNIDSPINVLCDWANLALKTVKGNVLVYYAFYDGTLRKRILDEKKIENEMYGSLIREEFTLFLQPKVHIPTSQVVGSEGLVRWRHPIEGVIPPDRFIPLFEKNGFIIRLDEYIWEQACIILRDWLDRGLTATPISVNVSRMHIHDTRLCEKLLALIKKYNLPPHLLELELTESVFLDSESQLFNAIRELKDSGFLLSLDDFGAGYSSLNMLKSLPIKTIKIDRGFLNEVVATERGKLIIRHAIALARDLDMEVIAEGVENRAQATFLLDAGCFMAQGFYYSPPVPLPVFEKMAFGNTCPFPHAPALELF
ncbi:MAG: EAL domain-containing protein, partial [Bilophila sp.]